MEFIRASIKTLVIFAVILIASQIRTHTTEAKSKNDLRNAFKISQTEEKVENYTAAIDALMGVYEVQNYELNLRLGWLNYKAEQFDKASNFYRNAVELKPFALEPRLGLSYPLADAEKWEELEANYKSILAIDPNNTYSSYQLGYMYFLRGEYTLAYSYFEKVVNLYPFDHYSVLMLGWTEFQLQKFDEAEKLFNRVLLINPDDESALEGLTLMGR